MMKRKPHCWVLCGGSSSIARAFAQQMAEREPDSRFLLAGRDQGDLKLLANDLILRFNVPAQALSFDILAVEQHAAFVDECKTLAGELPISLFIASAIMPRQAETDANPALLQSLFDTNCSGPANLCNRFLPVLEAQHSGHVVVLGAMAAGHGWQRSYSYSASKAALHVFAQGLRARLGRSQVNVLLVKPGAVDTALTFGHPGLFMVASPQQLARQIIRALRWRQGVLCYPRIWPWLLLAMKCLPQRLRPNLPG